MRHVMTETDRIKSALVNVITLAKNSIEYGKIRDDQDIDLIESIVCESLEWLNQEYKDPILDDVEREYLSAVIKPFRKKISCIRKSKDSRKGKNYIKIEFCDGDCMFFPNLSNNAMYKGMKLDRNYTLEELGI